MTVLSIDHVQLAFPQGEQAVVRHFYGQLLGLREVRGGGGTLRFEAGRHRVDLVPSEVHSVPQAHSHLALRVVNLPGFRSRLRAEGYEPDESRPLPGHLRLYVQDPAGHSIELVEPQGLPEVGL